MKSQKPNLWYILLHFTYDVHRSFMGQLGFVISICDTSDNYRADKEIRDARSLCQIMNLAKIFSKLCIFHPKSFKDVETI